MGTAFDGRRLVSFFFCQALYLSIREEEWSEMHEKVKEVSKKMGVKQAGQKAVGLGNMAWQEVSEGGILVFQRGTDTGV